MRFFIMRSCTLSLMCLIIPVAWSMESDIKDSQQLARSLESALENKSHREDAHTVIEMSQLQACYEQLQHLQHDVEGMKEHRKIKDILSEEKAAARRGCCGIIGRFMIGGMLIFQLIPCMVIAHDSRPVVLASLGISAAGAASLMGVVWEEFRRAQQEFILKQSFKRTN